MTEHLTAEMQIAKAYRDEGDQIRKLAAADRATAEYEKAQAERSLREIQALEKSIAQREQRLTAAGIADLDRREKAVAKDLAEIRALKASYDAAKHGAAQALIEINKREKREAAA
jgi:hypothetical protein